MLTNKSNVVPAGNSQAGANHSSASTYKIDDHNHFYLDEDRRREPREFFKFLVRLAESRLSTASTVLDVGCAAGEFLYYLKSLHPNLSLNGIDVSEQFL